MRHLHGFEQNLGDGFVRLIIPLSRLGVGVQRSCDAHAQSTLGGKLGVSAELVFCFRKVRSYGIILGLLQSNS